MATQKRAELLLALDEKRRKVIEEREAREVIPQIAGKLPAKKKRHDINTGVGRGVGGGAPKKPASARELAARYSMSADKAKVLKRRADALSTEDLEAIKRTPLDKGTELDALVKLPVPQRAQIVAKAIAEAAKPKPERQKVSAVAVLRAGTIADPISTGLARLRRAWEHSSEDDKAQFMRDLQLQHRAA